MRFPRTLVLALLLLAMPATTGCLKDIRDQVTTILFFVDASDSGVVGEFLQVNIIMTHVTFKPNETGVQPVTVPVARDFDLVAIHDGGPQRMFEQKIPYRVYDKVSAGLNVTGAIRRDGAPIEISVPSDNTFETVDKKFRTRLAGDVAYFFALSVQKNEAGEHFLQLRNAETGARRA
ncbi:MAG TPA: hypothetical protein VI997_08000 [Candidatus Thermoplasmatota archaeon]|nr:hypothetical protein [Candidatus Thermoplasmatota archaeon]